MKLNILQRTFVLFGIFAATTVCAQITPSKNKIGIDISTMPQNKKFNYDSCFLLGKNLGMSQVGLHQTWTALETAPNTFNLSILDIANIYYPAYNMPIDLNIDPLETNHIEVPSDLVTTAFDNSTMINRFKTLLDSVKIHIPQVTLSSLVIGSEGDVYMGNNSTLWSQYNVFYDSVSAYAKTLWPGVKIATELTFNGITAYNTYAQTLNTNSDYIGVSYYPLNSNFTVKSPTTVSKDLDTIVSLYNSKPICFYQYGYPSSASCNSSEAMQKQFITETFNSWDKHASNIRLIDFTWLHDMDTALVSYYSKYYGLNDTSFLEFLHTLGLRTWDGDGKDKPAFVELECQAKQRGYNSLPIVCNTNINENLYTENSFSIYPNPASDILYINLSHNKNTVQIYNTMGMLVKQVDVLQSGQINISDLNSGMYFVRIKNHPELSQKLIKN